MIASVENISRVVRVEWTRCISTTLTAAYLPSSRRTSKRLNYQYYIDPDINGRWYGAHLHLVGCHLVPASLLHRERSSILPCTRIIEVLGHARISHGDAFRGRESPVAYPPIPVMGPLPGRAQSFPEAGRQPGKLTSNRRRRRSVGVSSGIRSP